MACSYSWASNRARSPPLEPVLSSASMCALDTPVIVSQRLIGFIRRILYEEGLKVNLGLSLLPLPFLAPEIDRRTEDFPTVSFRRAATSCSCFCLYTASLFYTLPRSLCS